MKFFPTLGAERARELLYLNPETGILTWRVSRGRALAGTVAGGPNSEGYIKVEVEGKRYLAHRLAWLITHGSWPNNQIDHINGVRTDNRVANLRDVSRAVNAQNQRHARSDNSTGILGVSPERGRFRAAIQVGGRQRHLGYYPTADAAGAAYLLAKRDLHAGCTV